MPPPPPPPHSDSSNNMPPLLVSADDESYEFIRSIATYAATKLSSLSESDISLLSDDALSRLIESELHRLPEDELQRIAEAVASPFVYVLETIIHNIFNSITSEPKAKNEEEKESSDTLSEIALFFVTSILKCFAAMTVYLSTVHVFEIFFKGLGKKFSSFKHRHEVIVPIIATQEEKLKPSKSSILLSKAKYSRTLDLKGLRGIGETYIQETDTGFRQMMIQESFVNGESFSLPAITPM